jgi:hypothetical protein
LKLELPEIQARAIRLKAEKLCKISRPKPIIVAFIMAITDAIQVQ